MISFPDRRVEKQGDFDMPSRLVCSSHFFFHVIDPHARDMHPSRACTGRAAFLREDNIWIRKGSFIVSGYLRLNNSLFKRELLHQMIGGVGVRCGGSMSALCGDRALAEKERLLSRIRPNEHKERCGPVETRRSLHGENSTGNAASLVARRLWRVGCGHEARSPASERNGRAC